MEQYGPDASVREVKLTRWGGEDLRSLKNGQLIWVVNVDPDSVPPPPIRGGTLKPLPTGPDGSPDYGKLRYLLIFVDAESGEFLHSSGSVKRPS